MAVSYAVQATVVDINSDSPTAGDSFLVDSNVWFWMTYSKASSSIQHWQVGYQGYLNRALGLSRIYHSGLTLAELTHTIEKTEHEIYQKGTTANLRPKEFRHNLPNERSQVVSEVHAAWAQITSLADPLGLAIDSPTVSAALARLNANAVDGYDLFILESMMQSGVKQIITDDGDFATVSGIQLFTANRSVLLAARKQGKLITR